MRSNLRRGVFVLVAITCRRERPRGGFPADGRPGGVLHSQDSENPRDNAGATGSCGADGFSGRFGGA